MILKDVLLQGSSAKFRQRLAKQILAVSKTPNIPGSVKKRLAGLYSASEQRRVWEVMWEGILSSLGSTVDSMRKGKLESFRNSKQEGGDELDDEVQEDTAVSGGPRYTKETDYTYRQELIYERAFEFRVHVSLASIAKVVQSRLSKVERTRTTKVKALDLLQDRAVQQDISRLLDVWLEDTWQSALMKAESQAEREINSELSELSYKDGDYDWDNYLDTDAKLKPNGITLLGGSKFTWSRDEEELDSGDSTTYWD